MCHARYIGILLAVAAIPVVLLAGVNYLVDPYEVFRTQMFPEVGATQERYLKVEYLKQHPEFDTFLMGGSRMGTTVPADIEAALPGHRVYNFFVSSGNQYDNLVHSRWLLRTRFDVRRIFVQVDWPENYGPSIENPQYLTHPEVLGNPGLGFRRKYLFTFSYAAIEFKLMNNRSRKGEFQLPLEAGYFRYPERDRLIAGDCAAHVRQVLAFRLPETEAAPSPAQKKLNEQSLQALAQLVESASQRGTQVTVFVTPHHRRFLDKINADEYVDFLKELARITPYWNFGFYSPLTTDDCNYYEPSHYIAKVAPTLFYAMSGAASGAYVRHVNRYNVREEADFVRNNFRAHRTPAVPRSGTAK
jgi:hypothetical protein